jgi:trigger factor
VTVKEVKVPAASKIDDDFAKSLGLESLDKLKELMKDQVEQELNGLTRTYMKRKLLDQLAASPRFRRAADDGRGRVQPDLAAARA